MRNKSYRWVDQIGLLSKERWTRYHYPSNKDTNYEKRFVSSSSASATDSTASTYTSHAIRKPIDKILIANRGEIACRVIRTARRMGIKTVAIYSNVDGTSSLHARMADESHLIGTGPTPMESYLRAEEVVNLAQNCGVKAIHPGYGFLSENTNFASMVAKAGIQFIGPPASAIRAMGSKAESKAIMIQAGVPTTPGYNGENQEDDLLLHEAVSNVGFPLLIKASMGGGGKGMRIVWKESDFPSALDSCRRESQSAFGDTHVILEKYLVHPRHIEFQIMADSFGNAVYLHERDCSLQRRHQKVIEEAPATDLPTELRQHMGDMAVKAAKAVGYQNAGTVEFLLDTQSKDGQFYFCEMNTRLQVEHPITEMITGQDLVEWQIRIASGEELPIKDQSLIPCQGHAMEARIYAENPSKNFLPATGRIWHHMPPVAPNEGGSPIRVDTGIHKNQDITVYYDPMISKLIVYGDDREMCRRRLISSLQRYQIAGVPSNIPFLISCAENPIFAQAGAINTGFLEVHANDVKAATTKKSRPIEQAICALVVCQFIERRFCKDGTSNSMSGYPWSNQTGSWRMGGKEGRLRRQLTKYRLPGEEEDQSNALSLECISNRDGSFDISIMTEKGLDEMEQSSHADSFHLRGNGSFDDHENITLQVVVNECKKLSFHIAYREDLDRGTITVCGWPISRSVEDYNSTKDTDYAFGMTFDHPIPAGHFTSDVTTMKSIGKNASISSNIVKTPMPGRVTKVNVSEGDSVEIGQILIVVEAMKMEHMIKSPMNGTVSQLSTAIGKIVNDGDTLVILKDPIG